MHVGSLGPLNCRYRLVHHLLYFRSYCLFLLRRCDFFWILNSWWCKIMSYFLLLTLVHHLMHGLRSLSHHLLKEWVILLLHEHLHLTLHLLHHLHILLLNLFWSCSIAWLNTWSSSSSCWHLNWSHHRHHAIWTRHHHWLLGIHVILLVLHISKTLLAWQLKGFVEGKLGSSSFCYWVRFVKLRLVGCVSGLQLPTWRPCFKRFQGTLLKHLYQVPSPST